jgi:hypothetical protein
MGGEEMIEELNESRQKAGDCCSTCSDPLHLMASHPVILFSKNFLLLDAEVFVAQVSVMMRIHLIPMM